MDWFTSSPWPILTLVFLGTGLLIFLAWYLEWRGKVAYARLLATGEAALATVLSARDTGWRTNGRPHIAFDLEVRRDGHPPYRASTRLQLQRKWSPIPYGPGAVVRVRVDRDHPERVAIDGGEPVLGGAQFRPDGSAVASAVAAGLATGATGSSQVYIVNGTPYSSPDALPPELRAIFEQTLGAAPAPDPAERLRALKRLYDEGLITAEEYEAKRAAILETL